MSKTYQHVVVVARRSLSDSFEHPRRHNDKTGAPTNAVMTPVANSWGVKSVRAIISASNNKSAPTQAERGSRTRRSADTRRRTICGTSRPTKPMGPAIDTAAPREQRDRKQGECSRAEYRDAQPCAMRSPSANMLREVQGKGLTQIPRENRADVPSVAQSCPAKSPASHVRIASSVCSSRIRIAAVIEDTNADSATPHKVTFIGVNPERPAEESSNINRNNNAPP